MTPETYAKIKQALDKAEESTEPFALSTEKETTVFGDPNNTEIKKYSFDLEFETEDGRYTKHYKDLFVKPRKRLKMVSLLAELMQYFRKPMEDGTVGEYSVYEIAEIISTMSDEMYDKMYDLIMELCGIPQNLKDYISPVSVIIAISTLLSEEQGMVNEAEMSFEKSSGNP